MSGTDDPLPSRRAPPPPPDPFDAVSELSLRVSWGPQVLGSLVVLDPSGTVLARLRRDGEGLRIVLLNFVLEDPLGQPIFLIHQPKPKRVVSYGDPFALLDPGGTQVAEIVHKALPHQRYYFRNAGEELLSATVPGWEWRSFQVLEGSRPVATVARPYVLFPRPSEPGGMRLSFERPPSSGPPRRLIVALVAFINIFRPPHQWPLAPPYS